MRTASQRDIYHIYKAAGLHGARIVHLNRFLNMLDYLPKEENLTISFPVRVKDSRLFYEKGVDSHNWLFIANRTGLARTVTVILPDKVFSDRLHQFLNDFAYRVSGNIITGYTQDMPLAVSTIESMPILSEPLILNIDAGYFGWDEDPASVAAKLREKCPDIRMIVLSESLDEPEIGDESRRKLGSFLDAWGAGL